MTPRNLVKGYRCLQYPTAAIIRDICDSMSWQWGQQNSP